MSVTRLVVNAAPTNQQLVDYANAVAQVNLYAYAITQQSLPVLNYPPPNYAEFTTQFAPAKGHCLTWSGSIFPTMLSFPGIIATQANNLFNLEETMAAAYLQILKLDPTNQTAKDGLALALTTMQQVVQQQITTAQGLLDSMRTFSTDITADASTLSTIAKQALDDAGADKQKIDDLNTQIDNLNAQIQTMQTWLTVSEIGMGVSIFVGLVGAVVCFIPGAQGIGAGIIVIAVLGEAASIAGTVILNKQIQAAQDMITADQKQIDGLNQDIIQLQGVSSQFDWLVTANMAAQNAMVAVIEMWQALDDTLEAVKTDLTGVESDVTAQDYAQAEADLNAANADWQEVVTFANALAGINYQWQDQNGNWHNAAQQPPQSDNALVTPITQPATSGSAELAAV